MENTTLSRCFGCGKDNPVGLHLVNTYIDDRAHIEFEVKSDYCGHPGLLHGGVIGILFDEVMFYAIARLGIQSVTLNMTIDYKSPALMGRFLICEAWITGQEGRKIDVAAVITDRDTGRVIAESTGKYLEVDMKKFMEDSRKI